MHFKDVRFKHKDNLLKKNNSINTLFLLKNGILYPSGRIIFILVLIINSFSNNIFAQITDRTWDGSSSTAWNTNNNWSGSNRPNSTSENAIIPDASTTPRDPIYSTGTTTINDLTINSAGILSVSGGTLNAATFSNAGSLTISGGTLHITGDVTGAGSITVNNPGILTVDGNISGVTLTGTGIIQVGGTFNPGTFTVSTSTIDYNGTSSQNIANFSYYNLTISGSGGATLQSTPLTVSGNLDVTGTLNYGTSASTINVSGNVIGNGTINMQGSGLAHAMNISGTSSTFIGNFNTTNGSGSNVTFNYSGAQNIFGTGTGNFQDVTITGGNTKTLQGSATVNGTFYLTNGNVSLGASTHNLTIADGASIFGSFDNTHMIECTGSGSLIKQSTTSAGFVMTYPVGTGTSYTPMVISSLAATLAGTESISVRTVGTTAPGANSTDLARYWDVNTSSGLTSINADINFTYINPDDVGSGGDQLLYEPSLYSSGWLSPNGASAAGVNPISSTGTNILSGYWTAKEPVITYYSYQSGNWSSASTWTTDPSGTLWVNGSSSVPSAGDRVVILNGRTITTSTGRTVNSLEIKKGGILDIGTSTGHNFGTVTGEGKLILSSTTFPSGTFTSFVASGGGTVEMKNASDFNFTGQFEYNNLILNLSSNTIVATFINSTTLTINGDFTVTKGIFQINDASTTARTVTVYGDVTVSSNGVIQLGSGNVNHSFYVSGDFTNSGSVDFYEGTSADYSGTNYSTSAHADVIFNSSTSDQYLTCNGNSEFYRIEINKGTDQTYVLNIDASSSSNFNLYGRNNQTSYAATPPIDNQNALGLMTGTVRLGNNITIQTLATGNNNCFLIDEDAQLWLDGANATVKTAASGYDGLIVYGKAKFSNNCTFDCNTTRMGILTREASEIEIESGTLTIRTLRPSVLGGATHRGAFKMYGGTLTVTGWDLTGVATQHASFSIPFPDNVFIMTGGTIDIQSPQNQGGNGQNFSLIFGMNSKNATVSGGTIRINTTPRNAYFNSTIPLPNLEIYGTANSAYVRNYAGGGTPATPALTPQILEVVSDLSIQNTSILNTSNTGGTPAYVNVTVGGNFSIPTGTTYTPGTNTTSFDGSGVQTFTVGGTISGNLQNLTLASSSDLTLASNNISLNGDLTIGSGCTLRDNGYNIYVQGNITNSGTHFKPVSGAGSIQLTGTAVQTITGNGNGSFNNLTLNKTGGSVSTTTAITINGNLRLAGTAANATQRWSSINIGSNKLTLGSSAAVYSDLASGVTFNNYKMIQTTGYMTDDGLCRIYSSTAGLLFPFGFYNSSNTTYYYLPAIIQFSSAPSTYGSVTSRPSNGRHYLAQSTNSLSCYWRTSSSGFSGVPSGSVVNQYYYVDASPNYFIGSGSTETSYIPGVYRNGSVWVTINDVNKVDEGNNYLLYDTAYTADGDYTAGEPATFSAIPVLYSVADGPWNVANTWSTTSGGTPGNGGTPGSGTIVNIVDNHAVTTTASASAGSLYIESGSVLDLGTITGHNFAALPDRNVTGGGMLRLASSGYFPQGDFGDFIGINGGTVEYYTTTTNITIPTTSSGIGLSLSTYKNLKLSPSTGYNITLPLTNLTIYGNLTIAGSGSGANDGVRTPATSYSYTIDGNLDISSGLLEYRNGVIQTIKVYGNTTVANGAIFRTYTAGTIVNNILELYGNLANDGTFDMNNTGRVLTYFKGTVNDTISGIGATYDFYNLIVDKGSDQTAILSLQSNITTGSTNPFLTLSNGTFRIDDAALNVTISTINAFSIPSTACFSVNQGTATIGTTNNAGDASLSGKIEVSGGTLNIGSTTGYNNDIEYASAGTPTIYVTGGNLNIKGQIRRSTTITSGSLNYYQSGGTVTVSGNNNQATRAKIEVLNDGSSFIMSGGTLNILSANGTTFGDVYLRPDTFSVTGGTLQIGDATSTTAQTFELSSSVDLWNLSIGTASISEYVSLSSLSLAIQNNLTINGNSEFMANGFDVEIGGNLTNNNNNASSGTSVGGYQAGSSTQTTTFNGTSAQSISGSGSNLTNFANFVLDKSGTLTLNANTGLRINTNLTLTSGTLDDGGNTITLIGDIENDATHTSGSTSGGIAFAGSSTQYISGSGSGTFGNIILNNVNGINMTDNSLINGQLTFTTGSLYIDDYLLTLGSNATISGSTGNTKMIILNGVLSDQGVKKYFSSGNTAAFTYPIGISGKYTPVVYDFSANDVNNGYITVKPINALHKSVTVTPTNYIPFYWGVVSSGLNSFIIDQKYYYDSGDILGSEALYTAERFNVTTNSWTNLGNVGTGFIITSGHYINLAGVNYLDGEYTTGEAYTAQPTLYSIGSGDWNNGSIWSTTSEGSSCSCTPNGNPVVISAGDSVALSANSANSYSVLINGILNANNTTFHDLGHVDGTGKIIVSSTTDGMYVFPGGEYDGFLQGNTLSTVEFSGNTDATLPLKPGNYYKPYNNVILSGSGIKYMSAENMRVRSDLTISLGTALDNTLFNKTLYLSGDWNDSNTTIDGFVPGTGNVIFEGSSLQYFNVSRTENFYNFTIDNTSGIQFSGTAGMDVSKYLYLTNGVIYTSASVPLSISNTSMSSVIGGGSGSYVDGPLSKKIISGQSFTFPVGSSGRYGEMALVSTSASPSPQYWTATYHNTNPSPTYPTASGNLFSPITSVSDNEYWSVSRPSGGTARIRLRWDASSYASYTGSSTLRSKLRVVEYETATTLWTERSTSSGVSGSSTSGTITTTSSVSNDDFIFTIGVSGVTATITDLSSASICNNGSTVSVPVTLTGTSPWTLTYRTTGSPTNNYTQTGITSSTYNIQLTGADICGTGNGVFTLSLVSVTDASAAGVCNANTKQITVNPTYTPDISGLTTVGASEVHSYFTTNNSGSTYSWTWSGTSGGTFSTNTSNPTDITFTGTAGTYDLQLTETYFGCSATDIQSIVVQSVPAPSINPTTANVCINDVVTYYTASNAGHEYQWTVTNGSCTGCGTWRTAASGGNSISVAWTSNGSGTVDVIESTDATYTVTGSDSKNYNISSAISNYNATAASGSVCSGNSTSIDLSGSQVGITYQLRNATTHANIGGTFAGSGTTISLSTGALTTTTTFEVYAYNSGCNLTMTGTPTVTVNSAPTANLTSDDADNIICAGTSITFTATSGNTNYDFMVNGVSVQNGVSNIYITSTLANNDQVSVIATLSGCNTTSSAITNTVNAAVVLNVGASVQTCGTNAFTVSDATVSNYNSLVWGHNGLGGLTNGTGITPTYTPVAGDIGNTVILNITVIALPGCNNANGAKNINVREEPSTANIIHD